MRGNPCTASSAHQLPLAWRVEGLRSPAGKTGRKGPVEVNCLPATWPSLVTCLAIPLWPAGRCQVAGGAVGVSVGSGVSVSVGVAVAVAMSVPVAVAVGVAVAVVVLVAVGAGVYGMFNMK